MKLIRKWKIRYLFIHWINRAQNTYYFIFFYVVVVVVCEWNVYLVKNVTENAILAAKKINISNDTILFHSSPWIYHLFVFCCTVIWKIITNHVWKSNGLYHKKNKFMIPFGIKFSFFPLKQCVIPMKNTKNKRKQGE